MKRLEVKENGIPLPPVTLGSPVGDQVMRTILQADETGRVNRNPDMNASLRFQSVEHRSTSLQKIVTIDLASLAAVKASVNTLLATNGMKLLQWRTIRLQHPKVRAMWSRNRPTAHVKDYFETSSLHAN